MLSDKMPGEDIFSEFENKGICKLRSWVLSKSAWLSEEGHGQQPVYVKTGIWRLRPALFRFLLTGGNALSFLISPVSGPELSFVSDVVFPFPRLAPGQHWTFCGDSFHSYAVYSDLFQWKVNPVGHFANCFQSSIVALDYLKKQHMESYL